MSKSELERLADDQYKDRRITGSLYCGNCGYNLRTLPRVYTCPECGQEYNARPLLLHGIFQPHDAKIPFGDMIALVFCWLWGGIVLAGGFQPRDPIRLIFGLVLIGFGVAFLARAYREFGKLMRVRQIARRIEMEED